MSVVSLEKGQKVDLGKSGSGGLSRVFMGLGWDPVEKRGLFGGKKKIDVDLDASAVVFDSGGAIVDVVFFNKLNSDCGSIVHEGDNLTGAGDGDDEVINVDLAMLPSNVETIVFTVSSYRGHTLDMIENASCRLVDKSTGKELANYNLSGMDAHTALVMAKLSRKGGQWSMTAIGKECEGRTVANLKAVAAACI